MVDGSFSVYNEIASQRAYGHAVARNHYSRPATYWDDDYSRLHFYTEEIDLAAITAKKMMYRAEELMHKLRFQCDKDYLKRFRKPSAFHDDLAWGANGASLPTNPKNRLFLAGGEKRVLEWARELGAWEENGMTRDHEVLSFQALKWLHQLDHQTPFMLVGLA